MSAIALMPTLAAPSVVEHVHKSRNAPAGTISISPFTCMSLPDNAPGTWRTHLHSPVHNGSEENGDTRSRKEIRLTPFFNTHRQFRHRRIAGQRNGLRSVECAIGDPDRGNPDTGGGGCEDHTDGTGGTGCHAATAVARGGGG